MALPCAMCQEHQGGQAGSRGGEYRSQFLVESCPTADQLLTVCPSWTYLAMQIQEMVPLRCFPREAGSLLGPPLSVCPLPLWWLHLALPSALCSQVSYLLAWGRGRRWRPSKPVKPR